MKKFIASLLIVLCVVSPVFAQDATEEPPVVVAPEGDVVVVGSDSPAEQDFPTSYLVLGLIGLFVVAVGFWSRNNNVALENATQSIPLPIVEALFDLAFSAAQRTEDPIDDEALIAAARRLGYVVEANSRGGYDLSRPS